MAVKAEDEVVKKEGGEVKEGEEKADGEEEKAEGGEEKKDGETGSKKNLRRGQKRKFNEDEPFVVVEDEPDIDENAICLDWFNSDLSLRISKEGYMVAEPFFKEGWGYVWSSARATHGFNEGKVGFEVKLLEHMDTKLEGEKNLHELRLGWTTDDASLLVGESKLSYCYSGNGKAGSDSSFEDYGATFAKDDVVAAFVDFTNDTVVFSFTKNGEDQGTAYEVAKADLEGKALFPTVNTRNVKFEVNFGKNIEGEDKDQWFGPAEGHVYAANAESKVRGAERISERSQCEMIMLIGLPGAGKTTWVNKHVEENPEKRFNVIGTAALIEKMKVGNPC
jgi:heterogeneous nuclear ribonucleoprotein U-like protein 1